MKSLILCLCLLSFSSTSSASNAEIVQLAKDTTYLLQIQNKKGEVVGSGSGFAVSPSLLITNEHVVSVSDVIHMYNYKGEFISEMVVFKANAPIDMAILAIPPTSDRSFETFIPLYTGPELEYLDEVFGFGYPLGDGLFISKGTYQKKSKLLTMYHRMSMPVAPGMSGGPTLVYNEEADELQVIGIISAFATSGEIKLPTLSLFVHIKMIIMIMAE